MESGQGRIKVEYGPRATVVTFLDEHILDEQQIAEVGAELEPVIEKNGSDELLLVFENVAAMTSSMLGLLVRVQKRVNELEGSLTLAKLNKNLKKVFEITRLDTIFDIM